MVTLAADNFHSFKMLPPSRGNLLAAVCGAGGILGAAKGLLGLVTPSGLA